MQSEFRKAIVGIMPDLKRFAFSLARNTEHAEELLSSTLLRCLDSESSIQDVHSAKAFAFKVMFNQWRNARRRIARYEKMFEARGEASDFSVAPDQDELVDLSTAYRAVESLDEPYKTAIMLVTYDGMSYNEISSIMSAPEGTVRSWVFRARDMVRQMLEPALAPNMRGPRI